MYERGRRQIAVPKMSIIGTGESKGEASKAWAGVAMIF
jgi:hypothetical protein